MKRFKHNLSHYHLTTCNFGMLVPVQWTEILPGDSLRASSSVFLRCTPVLTPVMHPCQVRLHHFWVPLRILDDQWEDFITQANAGATVPVYTQQTIGVLEDFLGVPPGAAPTQLSQFPKRAYAKIWNEYYRDQETQIELDITGNVPLQFVNYEKDYWTTARLNPTRNPSPEVIEVQGDVGDQFIDPFDLRRAMARYKYDEARQRFGNRYTEYLRYLGVTPSDASLQRPEYISGGTATINFSEVLQTVDNVDDPLGKLGGHGVAGLRTRPFTKFFEEHGIFMTLLSVRPKSIYANSLSRSWKRFSHHSYWQKETQFQGLQPIFNYEVFCNGVNVEDNATFGYTDMHEDYRRGESRVSRQMRANLYDTWHLARQFDNRPGLNSQWAKVDPDDNRRIFADQINDHFIVATNHNIAARRLVTNNPTPRTT